MSKHAGIILAAGYSARMGCLKAALPFAGQHVISRQVAALRMAGCDPVIVVTGHEAGQISSLLKKDLTAMPVLCHNPDFDQGMFSSVQKGVSVVPDDATGFVILPVDCIRVPPRSVQQVIQAACDTKQHVILPCFREETGHPPWFPLSWKNRILLETGPLHQLIQSASAKEDVKRVSLDSPGVLYDMDTKEDYDNMLAYESNFPSEHWGNILMRQELPDRTVAHCKSVADLAATWARQINRKYPGKIDEKLTYAAGLLHDMSRNMPKHEREASLILRWHGYDMIADIVLAHMRLPDWDEQTITEKELVYTADKRMRETDKVSIEERYRPAKTDFAHDLKILTGIKESERKALLASQKIEELING